MSIERLIAETQRRMSQNKEERLDAARARLRQRDKEAEKRYAAQAVTNEMLSRTCSL
jgi:hypothetical protein